ncbi:hypothetical protein TYRP_004862 [Tyrophagus putrescentiae]|nr:hypothetical protein TYRP_004862 [Tyrophagus putrescentiae]
MYPYPFVPLNKQQQKRAKMAMIEVLAVCTKMSQNCPFGVDEIDSDQVDEEQKKVLNVNR